MFFYLSASLYLATSLQRERNILLDALQSKAFLQTLTDMFELFKTIPRL
ncbi:hypothetical protein [Chitinophaga sp. 212800010-3]